MPDDEYATQAPAGPEPAADESAPNFHDTPGSADLPMSGEEAEAVLAAADEPLGRRAGALDDSEAVDPLADAAAADPLADPGREAPEEEAAPAEEAHADSDPELPRRIRLDLERLDARDAAVLLHARKTGRTFAEAEAELFGAAPREEQSGREPAAREPSRSSSEIRADIEKMRADRRQAAAEYDASAQLDLTERIESAQQLLTEVVAYENVAAERHAEGMDLSVERAMLRFPGAFEPGTPLHDAIAADKSRIEQVNTAFFHDPEWPETLVFKHAARLGIAPDGQASRAMPARPAPRAAARSMAAPAPGGRSAGASGAASDAIRQRLAEAQRRGDGDAVDRILQDLERAAR